MQGHHENDLAKLLSSGFDAASTNSASTPLVTPEIRNIVNGDSGELIMSVGPMKNAKALEVRVALLAADGTPGPWESGRLFTNSRSMAVTGLVPGGNYHLQVRAIGGSTGYSGWSDIRTHRSL